MAVHCGLINNKFVPSISITILIGLSTLLVVNAGVFEDTQKGCQTVGNTCSATGPCCLSFSGRFKDGMDKCFQNFGNETEGCLAFVSIKNGAAADSFAVTLVGKTDSDASGWVGFVVGRDMNMLMNRGFGFVCLAKAKKVDFHRLVQMGNPGNASDPRPTLITNDVVSYDAGWLVCEFTLTSSDQHVNLLKEQFRVGLVVHNSAENTEPVPSGRKHPFTSSSKETQPIFRLLKGLVPVTPSPDTDETKPDETKKVSDGPGPVKDGTTAKAGTDGSGSSSLKALGSIVLISTTMLLLTSST